MMRWGLNFIIFLVAGIFILIEFNGIIGMERLLNRIEVKVFLDDTANPDSLTPEIKKELGVKELIFVSKGQALQEFKGSFRRGVTLFSEAEENPLPASFRIILKPSYRSPEYLDYLSHSLAILKGIKEVIYGKEYARNIWAISKYFVWTSYGIGGLLFFLLILTLSSTSNQNILAVKRDADLLKSFGVSKQKIKLKLSLQVFLENICLGAIALALVYGVYRFLLLPQITWSSFLPLNIILGFIVGVGLLSFLISLIVIRRI